MVLKGVWEARKRFLEGVHNTDFDKNGRRREGLYSSCWVLQILLCQVEDIPRSSHSLKGDKADLRHCVMDETQMWLARTHSTQLQHYASSITGHTFPPFLITLTITNHHLAPPHTEEWKQAGHTLGLGLNPKTDQNVGQDSPCECGQPTPPWTLPFRLLSRDVCIHKTSKQEHKANAMTAPPSSHDTRT